MNSSEDACQVESVNLNLLSGTALFKDYIEGKSEASNLFAHSPDFNNPPDELIQQIVAKDYDRQTLAETLIRQNEAWHAGEKTITNIEKLKNDQTLAIVTGQQTGFAGGPMYGIIKAIQTIKAAEHFEKLTGKPVVPIFWMELEDHDLAEIDHLYTRTRENEIVKVKLEMNTGNDRKPINRLPVGNSAKLVLDQLKEHWLETEFTAALFEQFESAYSENSSLSEGFARLLHLWLKDYGLIIADPSDKFFKKRASSVFIREIENPLVITEDFISQNQLIKDSGYHQQVSYGNNIVSLFLLENDTKNRLLKTDEGYYVRTSEGEKPITAYDLVEIARSEPERLIPSVFLRPLVQDHLFPTLAYVGGPAEIAYFAQITPAYRVHQIPMPMILPRTGITLLVGATKRNFYKFKLKPVDVLQPYKEMLSHVINSEIPDKAQRSLKEAENKISDAMKKLRHEITIDDKEFSKAFETTNERIEFYMNKLKDRYNKITEKQNSVVVNRVNSLSKMLYPFDKPQERVFTPGEFLNLYGSDFIDNLYCAIEPVKPLHNFLYI